MEYECARCHARISVEEAASVERCPSCGAEAGLEAKGETPLAMKLFGVVLVAAFVASLVSSALALGATA